MSDSVDYVDKLAEDLRAGWAEVSATEDKVANTKALVAQIQAAKTAIAKVSSTAVMLGGYGALEEAYSLGELIEDTFTGFSQAAITIALVAHLGAYLQEIEEVCGNGIKNAKNGN
jgi:hypothetical protein